MPNSRNLKICSLIKGTEQHKPVCVFRTFCFSTLLNGFTINLRFLGCTYNWAVGGSIRLMIHSETPPEISKKKNTRSNLQHERKRRRRRRRTFSSSHCVSVLGCCILVYFIGNHHLWGGKPCPILYWPEPFVAKVIKSHCLPLLDTPRA